MSDDNQFIKSITNILQYTSSIAIDLNNNFFGVDAKIYYPKKSGHYSGKHDDIDYDRDPSKLIKILIPSIYDLRRTPKGGINDNLFEDTHIAYCKHTEFLPYLSKIVITLPNLGTFQFLVDNDDAISTPVGSIYKEITLTPFLSFRNNDVDQEDTNFILKMQYDKELLDNGFKYYDEDGNEHIVPVSDDQSIAKSEPDGWVNEDIPSYLPDTPQVPELHPLNRTIDPGIAHDTENIDQGFSQDTDVIDPGFSQYPDQDNGIIDPGFSQSPPDESIDPGFNQDKNDIVDPGFSQNTPDDQIDPDFTYDPNKDPNPDVIDPGFNEIDPNPIPEIINEKPIWKSKYIYKKIT